MKTTPDLRARAKQELADLAAETAAREADTKSATTTTEASTQEHARRVETCLQQERARRDARRKLAEEEHGAQDPPKLLTLRERLARPQSPTRHRIEGWQPQGTRVVFSAQNKSGKTVSTQNVIRCLVDGAPWLGRYAATPVTGVVCVLDFEMNAAQVDGWFRDQQIVHDDQVIVESMRGQAGTFDITDPNVRARWAAWLRDRSVAYLILDCLRPCLDAIGLDENHDAGKFLVAFDALLAEAGISEAMVVHHMGHLNERSRGDSRILDWPDANWMLVRETDDPSSTRFIKAYGRDVEQPEQRLAYDPATRRLSVDGGSRRDQAALEALAAVLEVLDGADKPLSVRAIETALKGSDYSRDIVRAATKQGIVAGTIVTQPGPRNAILHSRNTQCAGVCGDRAAHSASECASASIETHTHTVAQNSEEVESARTLGKVTAIGAHTCNVRR